MKHSAIINAIFIVIYGGAIAIYLLTTSVVPKWLFAVFAYGYLIERLRWIEKRENR